jgi:hypothetical protein
MIIPPVVKILGQDFTIEFLEEKKHRGFIGRCFPHANRIQLEEGLCPDKMGETFLHEVLHAIDENLELGIKHKSVNRLGLALYQFLKENNYLPNPNTP